MSILVILRDVNTRQLDVTVYSLYVQLQYKRNRDTVLVVLV